MASPFAKYQSEQVQQLAPGFVEAYGRAGASIGQGIASIGASVAQGLAESDKRKKEDIATKAALAPYIRNDPRVTSVEDFLKNGVFTKSDNGTVVVSAKYADKVNMPEVDKVLSFYNETGGDGSKLSGDKLVEFTSRIQSEQKYVADQAGKAKAKLDLDLQQAQIDELKSKSSERLANAGAYGAAITATLGGSPSVSAELPSITLPDTSTPNVITGTPVTNADTTVPAAAAPAAISPALTAGTTATTATKAPAPSAPAAQALTSADFDKYGYPKQKATPAAQEAPAAKAPAAAAPAVETPAAAPAAPVTYDIPAKSTEVATKLKAIEDKRTSFRTKYTNIRRATEGEIAASRANVLAAAPRNKTGLDLANATSAYNVTRLKSVDEAEAREMKTLDSEAEFIKTDFTNYQASATAARQAITEDRLQRKENREIKKEEAAGALAEEKSVIKLAKDYPMIGVYTYKGYNLKDPKTGKLVNPAIAAKITPMPTAQYTEASEQNKGYGSAKNFLLNMNDVLRERERGGDEYSYLERFRLTAKNMDNYFKSEQASVFGVATFRKAIVSGGNFSDADREFVKQAITYLNSGAVDLTNKDLRSSLNVLAFMIDGMYRVNLEELGMNYNKEAALEKIAALRSGGDEAGAAGVEKQIKTTDRFNKTFNLQQDKASSISKEKIAEARATMQKGFKGFKFVPPTEESK